MFDPIDRVLWRVRRVVIVATFQSYQTALTLPGGAVVPAGALTAVTCRATHRRQGLLTRMITSDLAASHERGEVADILIAAEYPIYGRFGYGPAVLVARLGDRRRRQPVRHRRRGHGRVRRQRSRSARRRRPSSSGSGRRAPA